MIGCPNEKGTHPSFDSKLIDQASLGVSRLCHRSDDTETMKPGQSATIDRASQRKPARIASHNSIVFTASLKFAAGAHNRRNAEPGRSPHQALGS